jgi:hypothetical protein
MWDIIPQEEFFSWTAVWTASVRVLTPSAGQRGVDAVCLLSLVLIAGSEHCVWLHNWHNGITTPMPLCSRVLRLCLSASPHNFGLRHNKQHYILFSLQCATEYLFPSPRSQFPTTHGHHSQQPPAKQIIHVAPPLHDPPCTCPLTNPASLPLLDSGTASPAGIPHATLLLAATTSTATDCDCRFGPVRLLR